MKIRLMDMPLAVPRYRQVRLPTVAAELAPYAEVSINDENVEPVDLSPTDLVGFTAQPYNVGRAIRLARHFRAQGVKTIIGGPHATTMRDTLLAHFDAVVVGEVEGLGQRIVTDLERGRLAGVYENERPPDLAGCHLPRRDLQRAGAYYTMNFPIELSRGCPHRCSFCYGPYGFPTYRTRPLERIEADLDQWDHGYIEAVDMHFAADREHLLEVCELLERRRVWGWYGQATIKSMDDPVLLERMARSGCKQVFVGMESIEEAALLANNKGFNHVREYRRIIRMVQDHGIFVHAGLMWGLDGASPDCFDATARFCEETGIYLASTNMLTLFPGTPAHDRAEAEGRLLATDLRDYDGARITIAPQGMSAEEIRAGATRFMERFYSNTSIFRRSLQAGNHNIAQLWGFWGMNLAYRSYFRRWTARLDKADSPWTGADAMAADFPWVGGPMPWYYALSDKVGRLLTAGHKLWDRPARPAGAASTALLLAACVLASLLVIAGVHGVAALTWPVPFPGTILGLWGYGVACWISAGLLDRLSRAEARGPWSIAGLVASTVPMLAATAALPEHAAGWRLLCATGVLCFVIKAHSVLRSRTREGSLRVLSFLLLWPGFELTTAFRPDPTRALLVRHYPMMAAGGARLAAAALLFPVLFWLTLQLQQGPGVGLVLLGRALLVYLGLRGCLEWLTAYWRMVGCELPDPFGRRPFGPSPTALWRSWNVPYHRWLHERVYLPLGGRERQVRATMASFAVSGLAGVAVLSTTVGRLAWEPLAFFLAQGALVVLERHLAARSPGPARRRVLTLGLLTALLLAASLSTTGCTRMYAGMISTKVVADQRELSSYRGVYVERYPTVRDAAPGVGPRAEVLREVIYEAPSRIRVEVLAPAEHAGELIVYDGETLCMHFPREGIGLRIQGAEAPTPGQLRRMITEDTLWSWKHYAHSYRGTETVTGRETGHWKAVPTRHQPLLFPYEAWTDLQYSLPLKVEIRDSPIQPWYAMEFTELQIDVPVDPGAFSCDLPTESWVLDWDLARPGVPLDQLAQQLDFDLLLPEDLPLGLELRRALAGESGAPMAQLLMDDDGRWLSLTESHGFGRVLEPGAGIPIRVGDEAGSLTLMGSFSTVSWYAGNTALTLIGNLPYQEMVRVAASIEAPQSAEEGDIFALEGYRSTVEEACPACATPALVRRVEVRADGAMRVEITDPPERAGETLAYDGETLSMHWPQQRLGVRIRGAQAPTVEQLREMAKQDGLWALHHYDNSWQGRDELAGRPVSHWRSTPTDPHAGHLPYQTWLDQRTALPLGWEIRDQHGELFYATRTQEIELDVAAATDPTIAFPDDTRVYDWDLDAPGMTLEEQQALGFDLLLPAELPMELAVNKVLQSPDLPVVNVLMGSGARWLSMMESRHWGGPPMNRFGIPIDVAGRPGNLELSGSWSTVSWAVGNTALTLIGNLPYQEMLVVAASVQPAEDSWTARDPLAMGAVRSRLVERWAGSSRPVVRELRTSAAGAVRVEVLEPASRAGELFLYDGETITLWWPRHLMGVRIRGMQPPDEAALRASWEQDALWSLHSFDITYEGVETLAQRSAERWRSTPTRQGPYLHRTQTWLDRTTAFPLAVEIRDEDDALFYAMEVQQMETVEVDDPSAFQHRFPRNAVVFDWDLRDPGQPLEEIQRSMNFGLRLPTALPEGVELTKTVRGRHALPMAVSLMEGGQRWLSLTQARALPGAVDPNLGVPVEVAGQPGVLVFAGSFTSVSWNQGDAALTLVGNLPYPQLLAVAASVEPL